MIRVVCPRRRVIRCHRWGWNYRSQGRCSCLTRNVGDLVCNRGLSSLCCIGISNKRDNTSCNIQGVGAFTSDSDNAISITGGRRGARNDQTSQRGIQSNTRSCQSTRTCNCRKCCSTTWNHAFRVCCCYWGCRHSNCWRYESSRLLIEIVFH